ncbi:MAG: LapA family protein [Alphaproteobacteria bacterium]|nr:LapA family protein [Alphaproteobacteria bacterium]
MRLAGWLAALLAILAMVVFAIANRGEVAVSLDPLPFAILLPLYAVVMGALFVGLLVGGLVTWPRVIRWRTLARRRKRDVAALELQLETHREDRDAGRAITTPPTP